MLSLFQHFPKDTEGTSKKCSHHNRYQSRDSNTEPSEYEERVAITEP
jgi:hypothetical protein